MGCGRLKVFKELKPGEILALTGQVHSKDFKYDKVLIMYVGRNVAVNQLMLDNQRTRYTMPVVAAVCGINLKEHRIVDVAVHPYFRKMGFGKAIVELAVQEYGVTIAFAVTDEARDFWNRIGWAFNGVKIDKGTEVDIFIRTVKL